MEEAFKYYNSKLFPGFLQFESATTCQASCKMCVYGHGFNRHGSKAKWSTLIKIIEEALPYVQGACPFLMQEPCLEPRLIGILQNMRQVNKHCGITIYSNMQDMTPELTHQIIDNQLIDVLVTSFYAPDAETHAEWQCGLDYDKCVEKIEYFIKYRDEKGYGKPRVHMHMIAIPELMKKFNIFMKRWEDKADLVGVVHYDTFHGHMPDYGCNDEVFEEAESERYPCPRLWNGFNVLSSGDVIPCCSDFNGEIRLGNVREDTVFNIWRNTKFNELRQMHLDGRQDEIPLCKDCEIWKRQHTEGWNKLFKVNEDN